jgi:septal ring factor EnvC (AmiA/AmiB activator)
LLLLPGLAAGHSRREIAARAALLAERQVQAAAALRSVEDQTAQDATQLAALQAQQTAAQARLAQASAALEKLLPVMQRLATQPAATLLAAPLPPADSVRGIAIMQGVAATIAAQAQDVKAQSAQLAALIAQTQASQTQLTAAVAQQQQADAQLFAQISDAKPDELADADPAAAAAAGLAAAQHKLDTLPDAVTALVPAAPTTALPPGGGAPVAGRIVIHYGVPTLGGPSTGLSYATAPGAVVTTPCAGTVMFAGPFSSFGLLVITDCGSGASVVLAGMAALDVAQGQHLARGQPVGTMQGFSPADPAHEPHLYMELRQNGAPADPTAWLAAGGSG